MKKKIVLLLLILSVFALSSIEKGIYSNAESREGETISTEAVEDVNAVDIKEDLTQKEEEENIIKEDPLIPQKEGEEKDQQELSTEKSQQETNIENVQNEENAVINTLNTTLPVSFYENIRYYKYPINHHYLLVLSRGVNIREKPIANSKILKKASLYEKINLVEVVQGEKIGKFNHDRWYKVFWKVKDEIKYGYVFDNAVEQRSFQFNKMEEVLNQLKNEVENHSTAYIENYKNRNGMPPSYKGKSTDNYGETRSQSAPAYIEPNLESEFRYITDGTLVNVLDVNEDFYKISMIHTEETYWVPKKYISFRNSINNLKQVVVVDRKNQNEGVFEYVEDKWHLISYTFATTGEKAKYKEETPLGFYMVIEKRPQFSYYHDGTNTIAGYAPYVIRFTGGAYIHGVPVNYRIVEGNRVNPGMQEYLHSIGTYPRSHKCVRNYTSHAKFLYDWIEIGKSAVIVIE